MAIIIEDDLDICELISVVLGQSGLEVHVASHGADDFTKSFQPEDLRARIAALMRRPRFPQEQQLPGAVADTW